eukprot:SM000305S11799  [mRNA]  locus=s305:120507:122781:+ [translate_table: standard]
MAAMVRWSSVLPTVSQPAAGAVASSSAASGANFCSEHARRRRLLTIAAHAAGTRKAAVPVPPTLTGAGKATDGAPCTGGKARRPTSSLADCEQAMDRGEEDDCDEDSPRSSASGETRLDTGEEQLELDLAILAGAEVGPLPPAAAADDVSLLLGVDPDVSGALAVLRRHGSELLAEVMDVPFVKVKVGQTMRRRHNAPSIVAMLQQLNAPQGTLAYVEQGLPFPKDGKQGWYGAGYGYGMWIGCLTAAGFKVVPVPASVWKKTMGIAGRQFTKDDSRLMACSLFPTIAAQLKRKKDHGRAEALLIAAFGRGVRPASPEPTDQIVAVTATENSPLAPSGLLNG